MINSGKKISKNMNLSVHLLKKTNKIHRHNQNQIRVVINFEKFTYLYLKFIITHTNFQEKLNMINYTSCFLDVNFLVYYVLNRKHTCSIT